MGQYIQIGICTKLIVEQAGIARAKTFVDEVAAAISEQSIDLSLFAKKEDTETVTWELPEAMLNDGLVDFLRDQFLLTRTTLADEQATLLAELTDAGTWERRLGVIEEDGDWVLHRGAGCHSRASNAVRWL